MPIYEYECPVCKTRVERLVLPHEEEQRVYCPKNHLHYACRKVMPTKTHFRLINGPSGFWSSHGYADRITPENDTSVM